MRWITVGNPDFLDPLLGVVVRYFVTAESLGVSWRQIIVFAQGLGVIQLCTSVAVSE